jgi:ribose 5-phosphate isomerase B
MRIAVASDEKTALTDFVVSELQKRGHEVILIGPLAGEELAWADAGLELGRLVASKEAEIGVGFCWTGTGMSIAANKVPGVRAALCFDAETARGARRWNDANVLVMSLRATSPEIAREMLDAFLSTPPDESERPQIEKVSV